MQGYLLRASQLNTHLREMDVAAAGLAHETRNPLNIVRGLAQMISQEPIASEEIKNKSLQITNEVDRVTAQLNEFINYSRPREVRRAPVALSAVVGDVVRALQSDIEDKAIPLKTEGESFTVDADEQMLRQVLFNLLINSVQAVGPKGEIQIVSGKSGPTEAQIEVRDNGPGVPPEHRTDIFKPYFTTNPKGTGLGLAIVQQIVLAHRWDIEYAANRSKGAVFRHQPPKTFVQERRESLNCYVTKAQPIIPGRNVRVLIVDDDAGQRSLLDSFLKGQGLGQLPSHRANGQSKC